MSVSTAMRIRRGVIILALGLAATGLMWRAVDLQLTHKDFLKTPR